MWDIISTAATLSVHLPDSEADDAGLDSGDRPGIETTVPDPVAIRGASESDEFEATIREEKWTATSLLVCEPYDGWHIIAAVEDRRSPARGYNETDLHSCLAMGVERQPAGDDDHFLYPPFGMVSVSQWFDSTVWPAHLATLRGPLLALAVSNEHFRDDASALGLPRVLLAPSTPLVAVLNLRPTGDLVMVDDQGPALALVSWRADYSSSEYFLAYPRLVGCAIVLRPDLAEQLAEKCGDDLTLRWHVRGNTKLKRPAQADDA
jgi:hypothetical protein